MADLIQTEQNKMLSPYSSLKKNSNGEIFNIAKVEFSGINYKSRGDYKNQLACETPIVLRRKWNRPRVFSTLHAALISKEITIPAASLLLLHTESSGGVIPLQWLQPPIHHQHQTWCKNTVTSTRSLFCMLRCNVSARPMNQIHKAT